MRCARLQAPAQNARKTLPAGAGSRQRRASPSLAEPWGPARGSARAGRTFRGFREAHRDAGGPVEREPREKDLALACEKVDRVPVSSAVEVPGRALLPVLVRLDEGRAQLPVLVENGLEQAAAVALRRGARRHCFPGRRWRFSLRL